MKDRCSVNLLEVGTAVSGEGIYENHRQKKKKIFYWKTVSAPHSSSLPALPFADSK